MSVLTIASYTRRVNTTVSSTRRLDQNQIPWYTWRRWKAVECYICVLTMVINACEYLLWQRTQATRAKSVC